MLRCDLSTVLRTKVGWAWQHTLVILACGGRGIRANLGYMRLSFKRPKVCVGRRCRRTGRMSKNKGKAGDRAPGPLGLHKNLL